MSNSLVRKSLELLGYEKDAKQEKRKKKRVKSHGTLDLIPAKHRILSKESKTDLVKTLGRSGKVTVYEAQKRRATQRDTTVDNVQKLLLLSKSRLTEDGKAEQLLERAVRKRAVAKQEQPTESQSTAFTEEDFKKFEEEYMNE